MGLVARTAAALVLPPVLLMGQSGQPQSGLLHGRSVVDLADSLLYAGNLKESWTVLATRLAAAPRDHEARWRATRVALGLGIIGTQSAERVRWLREADQQGRELLQGGATTPDEVAWAAAARGRLAMSENGARTPARLAAETWELTARVLSMQPEHALANEVRGKLHAEVSRLPAVSRLVARLLLGAELMNAASSWALAERHLRRAIDADPGLVVAYLDLGDALASQERWQDAGREYRRGIVVPSRYTVDDHFKAIMRQRLAALPR